MDLGKAFPSQAQLTLPLMDELRSQGGAAAPAAVCDALAERFEIPADLRDERRICGGQEVNIWNRHVRWARQKAKLLGLIDGRERSIWRLSEKGADVLENANPGVVVTVYETPYGMALWAEAESAVSYVEDASIRLLLTSPPYPLLNRKRYAGQHDTKAHVDWLFRVFSLWKQKLASNGSMVVNLGDVWQQGTPTMDPYADRLLIRLIDDLGMHLAQRLYWVNPSKMPGPAEWVSVRRVRVTPAVESLWWLAASPHPKANNRNVLRAYSESMRSTLRKGGNGRADVRPSGHVVSADSFSRDNGGSIPNNCLIIPNTASNTPYHRFCREKGFPAHPARFPVELAEWCIKLMTDPGELVVDPFLGSGSVAEAAEKHQRRWIGSEKALTYLRGSRGRFDSRHLTWLAS